MPFIDLRQMGCGMMADDHFATDRNGAGLSGVAKAQGRIVGSGRLTRGRKL